MQLSGMSFTLIMDRPVEREKYYISPGGYNLGGKQFDFCHSEGEIDTNDRTRVHFYVDDFDEDYSQTIVPADIWKTFSEFFVYTGEYDEPEIHPVGVENIRFYFDNVLFNCPIPALESANKCIAA